MRHGLHGYTGIAQDLPGGVWPEYRICWQATQIRRWIWGCADLWQRPRAGTPDRAKGPQSGPKIARPTQQYKTATRVPVSNRTVRDTCVPARAAPPFRDTRPLHRTAQSRFSAVSVKAGLPSRAGPSGLAVRFDNVLTRGHVLSHDCFSKVYFFSVMNCGSFHWGPLNILQLSLVISPSSTICRMTFISPKLSPT